ACRLLFGETDLFAQLGALLARDVFHAPGGAVGADLGFQLAGVDESPEFAEGEEVGIAGRLQRDPGAGAFAVRALARNPAGRIRAGHVLDALLGRRGEDAVGDGLFDLLDRFPGLVCHFRQGDARRPGPGHMSLGTVGDARVAGRIFLAVLRNALLAPALGAGLAAGRVLALLPQLVRGAQVVGVSAVPRHVA